ncbi:MAG: L,D-transpeptidase family protein [Deltaproteobacteria bacterium]|nr:L,D-transpeptidase family protein [Deltaproteobacteria bacterium]
MVRAVGILGGGILFSAAFCLAATPDGAAAPQTRAVAALPDVSTQAPALKPAEASVPAVVPAAADDASATKAALPGANPATGLDAVPALDLAPETAATKSAPKAIPVYERITGKEAVHVVSAGETLALIAKRFGTRVKLAASMNSISDPSRLKLGQRLLLSNRRIIPAEWPDGLVVDLAVLALYWIHDGEVIAMFPVAAGRENWETPAGQYTITGRRRDPTWRVPLSIQHEMKEKGETVKTKVPPGPDNPLGKYWLQLSHGGIGIHGTNAPWTVGRYATHGCIRLREADIERLFNEIRNGTRVAIVDDPIRIARLPDGHLMLEAHSTTKKKVSIATLAQRLQQAGLADEIDSKRVQQALREGWGVAVDVTRKKPQVQASR